MPENKNLAIWEQVKATSEKYTKTSNQDGRRVTSINHIGMVQKATELWGPMGLMWGYEIVDERDDQGKPNWHNDVMVGHDITHTLRLRLWYEIDGKRGSIENFGHTPRIYWSHNNKRFVEDKEAAKKSLTDAFKKCMSFLGFSADIYGGEWDDPEYRRERQLVEQVEKAEDKDAERDRQVAELVDYVKRNLAAIERAQQLSEAAGVYKASMRHLERQTAFAHLSPAAKKGMASIGRAYEDKKQQLEKGE